MPLVGVWSSRAVPFKVLFLGRSSADRVSVSSSHLKQRQDFLKGKRVFTRLWCVKPLQCTWLLRSLQAGSRDKPGQIADKAVVPAVLLPEPSGCETVRYLDPLLGAEASEPYAKDRDDLLQVLV